MDRPSNKRSGYLSDVMKEVNRIIDQADNKSEAKAALNDLISKKILESYKNGIATGSKQADRD